MYPSDGGRVTRGPQPYLSQPADRALYAIEDDEESGYASSHAPSLSPASSHSSVPHYSYRPEMHAPPAPLPAPQPLDGQHLRAPLPRPVLSPSPPQPRVAGLPDCIPNLRDRVARDDLQYEEEEDAERGQGDSGSDGEYEEFCSDRPSQIHVHLQSHGVGVGETEGRTAPGGEGEEHEHEDPGASGETGAELADSREGQHDSALRDSDDDDTLVGPVRQATSEHPLQTSSKAGSRADKTKSKASRSAR